MNKRVKLELERLKKAAKLIREANRLLEKCENSSAIHSELFHAGDRIEEDIEYLRFVKPLEQS